MSDSARIKELRKEIKSLCGNCDRPDKEELSKIILSSMALGFSVGLEAPSADRPQGVWSIDSVDEIELSYGGMAYEPVYKCSYCGRVTESYVRFDEPIMPKDADFPNYCGWCGCRMKGADDE